MVLCILMEYHLCTRRLTGIYCWRQSSCSVFGGLTAHYSLPHRAIPVNQLLHGPRNSVRCFLTAATLDCFARSNVTLLLCLSKAESSPLLRVGQGFWVYGIQGLFKSGIRYISAEIWVFGISRFLNFRYKVYLPFLSL